MRDEIVEEVQKARRSYGERFGFELEAIGRDLREQERKSGKIIVNLEAKSRAVPSLDDPESGPGSVSPASATRES